MIQKYFALGRQELEELPDDDFYDLAAKAFYLQKKESESIKAGVLEAIATAFSVH